MDRGDGEPPKIRGVVTGSMSFMQGGGHGKLAVSWRKGPRLGAGGRGLSSCESICLTEAEFLHP